MSVMPLYNVLVLPGAKFWLHTNVYRELAGKDPEQGERVTLLMQKADQERRSLNADSFYPIGLTGAVSEIDENGFLAVDLESRINIDEITLLKNRSFSITATRRPDFGILDETDAAERLAAVKDRILTMARGQRWEGMLRNFASRWDSLWTVAAAMSPFLTVSAEERYALLSDDDVKKRFEAVERILFEGLELVDVQSEARTAQREDHEKLYRESAIRKQIEYLQKELDEMHPENVSELRRLELQLEGAGMNESALKEGRKVLNRLKGESANSPEAGMLTDWLDLLTGLPWKKAVPEPISMEEAETVLNADHAGLEKVKERILQQIAVIRLKGRQAGSILCFVGAPGTGKTSIGESIARALKRKYVRISLGGVHDESDIRGHRRTYIGAMPGRIIDGIHKCGSSNPVIVLDEVDKLFSSYQGDPASALLEVLDPEQNFSFTDHYLNVPFDLSDVLFICTANTVDTIPSPLLDRMEVIPFRGYTPIEKHKIAREHLLPKALNAIAIPESCPLVIAGGHSAYNPEPMAPYIDAFVIGEGEEVVPEIIRCYQSWKRSKSNKLVLLEALAEIEGVYIPSFYEPYYNDDGTLASVKPVNSKAKSRIKKRIVPVLPEPPERFIVPSIDVVQNRVAVEIMRGCSRGCRFCQAGFITRPVRERPADMVIRSLSKALDDTGYEEAALLSLSSSDYRPIQELVTELHDLYQKRKLNIALPSLRIDTVSVDILEQLRGSRAGGFTLAPEAASEKIKKTINKYITEEQLLHTAEVIYGRGWTTIKLYFMIGLPNETMEDVQAIADLAIKVIKIGRRLVGKRSQLNLGVATFVPKPHTPFQWAQLDDPEVVAEKQALLKNVLKTPGVKISWSEPDSTMFEAWSTRGDRRMSKVIYRAWQLGAKLDAWADHYKKDAWMQAFEENGLSPEFYVHRKREADEIFPWDIIDPGVSKRTLRREYENSLNGVLRPDCRTGCYGCGIVQAFHDIQPEEESVRWFCPLPEKG